MLHLPPPTSRSASVCVCDVTWGGSHEEKTALSSFQRKHRNTFALFINSFHLLFMGKMAEFPAHIGGDRGNEGPVWLMTSITRDGQNHNPGTLPSVCILCPFRKSREEYIRIPGISRCFGQGGITACLWVRRDSPTDFHESAWIRKSAESLFDAARS